jgi:ubiquitin-protein ligase
MSLPRDILVSRLKNELAICSRYLRHPINATEEDLSTFPVEIEIVLIRAPGPVLEDCRVTRRYHHRFSVMISEDYPFEKPYVIWRTPIFHPNVMMPEDGGFVCNKLLDEWTFNSTLLMFDKGIEYLLLNPNPQSPFGTESCTAAAQYFNTEERSHPPVASAPLPKVVRSA